jgi:hypothetical protein
MNLQVFLIILAIQIIITLPNFIKTCKYFCSFTLLVYLFHHAYDVFLFWAPFFLNKAIEFSTHFLLALVTGLHWFMNDNNCIITEYMNELCGYRKDAWLDSIKNKLGLRSLNEYFQFIWVGLLMVYDGFMIRKLT